MFQIRIKMTVPLIDEYFLNNSDLCSKYFKENYSKYRFFLGEITKIKNSSRIKNFLIKENIIVYLPLNTNYSITESEYLNFEDEENIIKLEDNVNFEEQIIAASISLKVYNNVFIKGKLVEGENVLILNGGNQFGYICCQLINNCKGYAFVVCKSNEEYDFLKKLINENLFQGEIILNTEDFKEIVREQTGGLGNNLFVIFFL